MSIGYTCENVACGKREGVRLVAEGTDQIICSYCHKPQLVFMSRAALQFWISTERREYADVKYPDKDVYDEKMRQQGIAWWMDFMPNYLSRAEILGLDTPQGRQALGKLITTAMDCLESAIRVHGEMPRPGVTSGEIHGLLG